MYQGKHHKKSCRRSRKSAALLVSLLLLLTVTVGGTIAFLMDSDGPLANLFTPSQVTTEVEETFDGTTKSKVSIKNTGNTDAWIRAAVVITWQDKDGNVYGQAPVVNMDYNISYNISEEVEADCWVEGEDGFYYWTSPVAAKADEKISATGILIGSCTALEGKAPDGYYLTVEIIGSGIQSKPANVFNTEWSGSGLIVDDSDSDSMQWTLSKEVRE